MGKEKNPKKEILRTAVNRRESERVDFTTTSWVFALTLPDELLDGTPLRLEAKNISLGGIKFQTNKKIPLFSVLSMQLFERNGKAAPLVLSGKVVRIEEVDEGLPEKTYGIATRFEGLNEVDQTRLNEALGQNP